MKIKIEIGDAEVISTGTVIGVIDKPIIFYIEDLIYELWFKINREDTEQKLLSDSPPNEKKLVITFQNFNNSLGSGNTSPLHLGFINDKLIFFNYRVYSLADNAGKLLHYTWFLEKKGVQNGQ